MYDEAVWQSSPMNTLNNVNGVGKVGRYEVYGGKDRGLLAAQEALTRKLVTELKDFDNVYFEVCNEPYERGGLTKEWNDRIVAAIVGAEADLPAKHLIAQGMAYGADKIEDPNPHVSVFNFHNASPESVRLNYGLNKAIAYDETGFADTSDRKYRTEGWDFILAGGGVFDHLDFSFTPARPDGTAVPLPPGTPGGGGPELRRQLQVLKEFIEGFDFVRMKPDNSVVKGGRVTAPLAPGDTPEARVTTRVLAEAGKAYAVYVRGGARVELVLELPGGRYKAEWVNTKTGKIDRAEEVCHGGGQATLASPDYVDDIALRVKRVAP
jgi:hypothetical protein